MKKEPAVIIGAAGSVVTAIIGLLVAFGLNLTQDQQTAITGIVLAIVPIIVGVVTRQFVYAPATVAAVAETAASGTPAVEPAVQEVAEQPTVDDDRSDG